LFENHHVRKAIVLRVVH